MVGDDCVCEIEVDVERRVTCNELEDRKYRERMVAVFIAHKWIFSGYLGKLLDILWIFLLENCVWVRFCGYIC